MVVKKEEMRTICKTDCLINGRISDQRSDGDRLLVTD